MNTSSNDTGSLSFALKWETPSNIPLTKTSDISSPLAGEESKNIPSPPVGEGEGEGELSYAPIDCTAIGVSTVSANVYDSGGTYITSGGPWNCADHSGTITGISAGINRMIAVSGKDSSNRIIYNGQITGVTIDKDQTTNAGQITMTYVANDTTAPTDGTLSASAGNSQVSLSWSGFSDSGSGLGSYKLVYSTTGTPSSCSSGTQIFTGTGTSYTHTGLTNSSTYYYRVCAIDNAGNTSGGATTSGTPQSTGTTATTTTTGGETTTSGSAPSAPTGVSATAGNGQTTVSWSSVSDATSYNIYWSTSTGVTKTTGTKITGATSSYTHTGRTNGTTYYYVVTAVNSYGESGESSQVNATPTSGTSQQWTMLKLPDTGQTTSYTTTFGEDNDYTINSPSYTDNGNGTITDNVTGLMWQKEDDNTTRTWADAGTYCDNLTLGSQTDWRLPSDMELMSIVNYGTYNPAIDTTYFPNTNASYYWSSTTPASYSSDVRYVYFGNGYVSSYGKSYSFYVRCVRGGQ